jgi:hypothetical protein
VQPLAHGLLPSLLGQQRAGPVSLVEGVVEQGQIGCGPIRAASLRARVATNCAARRSSGRPLLSDTPGTADSLPTRRLENPLEGRGSIKDYGSEVA